MWMPTVIAALRFLGWHGIIAVAVIVFYEGVPLVKSVPYIEYVPVVSDLAFGRVDRAFDAGALSERLAWQEKQRRASIKLDDDRRATQAKIDRIEAEYWSEQTSQALHLSSLEKALEAERAENAQDPNAKCRPAVSKRVRDLLAPLGR